MKKIKTLTAAFLLGISLTTHSKASEFGTDLQEYQSASVRIDPIFPHRTGGRRMMQKQRSPGSAVNTAPRAVHENANR